MTEKIVKASDVRADEAVDENKLVSGRARAAVRRRTARREALKRNGVEQRGVGTPGLAESIEDGLERRVAGQTESFRRSQAAAKAVAAKRSQK